MASLEENYRRWLRAFRNQVDSELAAEKRAGEWAEKTLPRLEKEYKRLHLKRVDEMDIPDELKAKIRNDEPEDMPEELKLYMLKDSVIDSMLREETEIQEVTSPGKKKQPSHRRNKSLVAVGIMLSTAAVLSICGFLFPGAGMSLSESLQIACWQTAMVLFYAASLAIRDYLRDFGSPTLLPL